jgi:hypothetical protein
MIMSMINETREMHAWIKEKLKEKQEVMQFRGGRLPRGYSGTGQAERKD